MELLYKTQRKVTCDLSEMMSVHENEDDILKLDSFSWSAVFLDPFPHVTSSAHMRVTGGELELLITTDGVTDQSYN